MPLLVIDSGAHKGQRVTLQAGAAAEFTIGRDETATLRIDDKRASRLHSRIRFGEGGRMIVEDLESRNGTYLNGVQLARPENLALGDQLQVGDTVLSLLPDESSETRASDPWEGKELAGYRLLQRVGRGGMGTVYRAVQKSLGREIALKVLSPKLSEDPERIRNFVNEARAAGQLNHPHIIQVYDVQKAEPEGVWCFSMEYASAGSIMDELSAKGSLPIDRALQVVLEAARGLLYAEQKGIVHRDIKPDNLMVTAEGAIKIGDLGLAHPTEQDTGGSDAREKPRRVFGTPHYIAPEQAQGKPVDHRADLYSLGASFYRIVAGRPPFDGKNSAEIVRKHVSEIAPPLAEVAPHVPKRVTRIIERLMQKRPEDRYASTADLIAELETAARGVSRKPLLLGAIGLIVAIAVVFGVVLSGKDAISPQNPDVTDPVPVGPGKGENPTKVVDNGDPGTVTPPDEPSTVPPSGDPAQEAARLALEGVATSELEAALVADELAAAYRLVAQNHRGTPAAQEAELRARRIDEVLEQARRSVVEQQQINDRGREALANAIAEATPLLDQRRYGQAIARVEQTKGEHPASIAGGTASPSYATLYSDRARTDLEATKVRANQLALEKNWDQALAELQKIVDLFGISEMTDEAEHLRQHLDRQRRAALDAQRREMIQRDQQHLATLEAALGAKREQHRFDYSEWARELSSEAASFETSEFQAGVRARASDFERVSLLLAEMVKRYDRADGFKIRGFRAPAAVSAPTDSMTFTRPGEAGHTPSDGKIFKVSFVVRGSPVITTLKLADFKPEELLNLLPTLWEFTAQERLALGTLAATEGLTEQAKALLEALTDAAAGVDAATAGAARDMLERLSSNNDMAREAQAHDLVDSALKALEAKDYVEALTAFEELAKNYATSPAVAALKSPDGKVTGLAAAQAYIDFCRKAKEAVEPAGGTRYSVQCDPQVERARAMAAARIQLEEYEKSRQWYRLGRLYQRLESFDRALAAYKKFEEEYRDTETDEIKFGTVYVRLAECSLYNKRDTKAATQWIAKARAALQPDLTLLAEYDDLLANFDSASARAKVLIDKRKAEHRLTQAEQEELLTLFGEKLRADINYRAEIFNLLQNFEKIDKARWNWELLDNCWNTADYATIKDLGPKFISDFPETPPVNTGEAAWRVAESCFNLDEFRFATRHYKWLQDNAPTYRYVTDGTVGKRLKICEKKSKK